MADHQKIHPVDVEAPTAPLAPRDSFRSEKGDPAARPEEHPPPPPPPPPPQVLRRTLPVSHSKPLKRRSCCCRFLCWTLSIFLILLVLIATTGGILYLVFRPKLPKYSVDRLRISDFQVNTDMSVYARFDVRVTARNPNKKIGIYYEKGSNLSVWYSADTNLCSGTLPKFYQGHRNTTLLDVALTGRTQIGSALWTAMQQQQQTGRIPLEFKGDVPVRVKFGSLKLMKVRFLVSCSLVVDNLSPNNLIRITTSSCGFDKLKL